MAPLLLDSNYPDVPLDREQTEDFALQAGMVCASCQHSARIDLKLDVRGVPLLRVGKHLV